MGDRLVKLNALLRDVVAKVILEEADIDDSPLVTVVRADVSPTLEHATVWISVLPIDRGPVVLDYLKQHIYHLQQMINQELAMRPVPKIRFEIDTTEERAARIEKLLDEVEKPEADMVN